MGDASFPRDLLGSFIPGNLCQINMEKTAVDDEEDGIEIELSLGLSLNGWFGVDPNKDNNIIRSASISNFMSTKTDGSTYTWITRTSSLPMEAKRKPVEKLENGRVVRGRVDCQGGVKVEAVVGGGLEGSFGSQESASSGISDFESSAIGGTNKYITSSVQSVREKKMDNVTGKLGGGVVVHPNPCTKNAIGEKMQTNEMGRRNMMGDMPFVSTRGDGPNGKRIEGFLYRYKKGEEVRIVCVCHGSFLSPTEFIKHAGGSNVEHPLKHIVVSASPFLQM